MSNIKEYFIRLKIALKNYFKGILLLALLTFIVLAIGLKIIGIDNWALKAFGIALVDLIPIFGSGTVMIPWAILRAINNSINSGAQIAMLYVIIMIVRFISEPLIVGKSVGISPLLTLAITIICIVIFGPIGAIIGGFITVPLKVLWDITSDRSTINSSNYKEIE